MAGELHELSVAIGEMKSDIKNIANDVQELKENTTKEHNKVHDIVDAMSEGVRNLTHVVSEMKPLTDDYRDKRDGIAQAIVETTDYRDKKAEARGVKRFLGIVYALGGGTFALYANKLLDYFASLRTPPHIPAVLAIIALLAITMAALAQEHHHRPEDIPIHEKFYSTWYMPDQPTKSCCNKADCYPTEVTFKDGTIYARRREDGKWLKIPANKVEHNRDNPDGRNHLCAPMPSAAYPDDTVFCFALGTGG